MTPTGRRSTVSLVSQRRHSVVAALLVVGAINSLAGMPGGVRLRAAGEAPPVVTGPQLRAVSATLGDESTTLTIEASDPVAYLMSQPDPFTLVLDLRSARAVGAINNVQHRFGHIAGVSVEEAAMPDGTPSARVRVRFNRVERFNVRSAREVIVVEIGKAGEAGPGAELTRASARLPLPAPVPQPASAATRLNGTRVEPAAVGIVLAKSPAVAQVPPTFAAQIGTRRPLGPPEPMTALTLGAGVRADRDADAARVLSRPEAPRPVASSMSFQAAPPPAPVVAPAAPRLPAPVSALQAAAQQAQSPAVSVGQPPNSQRAFTGEPVVLDFQGADLRAVLRTFSEISGLNMVIDPTVQGSVDVALRDVPWDQALDIILRANKLGYVIDGTIVRIAPLTVLADEEGQRRKLAEEQALAGELRVFTQTLSYARAEELAPLLTRAALTARGTIQVDERTNTLIITDLPSALETVGDLIGTLDAAQPQVEIEARIVQTTRSFARELGVQWGFNGRVANDLGNTTGLAFPNQGSLTGRTGLAQGAAGQLSDSAATAVNLGVEGAANAIGLALGSVNGAVNLDVALSALEESGQGRLLSTPRVSTQNNVEAEITQGIQIPIQTVANNTVTVSFKDAALTMKVTPQITAANTVILRINVENAAANFSEAVNGIPPIDTQRAITQVLVNDGETTVIGGIYTSNAETNVNRTPGLHRIPLLGWLFRREEIAEGSRELLIFITPRIIKG